MKVVFDGRESRYLCIGYGFAFKAWFAGEGRNQVVEAEIFNKDGSLIDVIEMSAPEGVVPSPEAVAGGFSPILQTLQGRFSH